MLPDCVHHSRRPRKRAIGTTSPAITATTAVRPSMAASASSKTAARASSISAVSDRASTRRRGTAIPPAPSSGLVQHLFDERLAQPGQFAACVHFLHDGFHPFGEIAMPLVQVMIDVD